MRRSVLLAALAAPLVLLSACGGAFESCESQPAAADLLPGNCSVAPGSVVSIDVALRCDSCRVTSPSCNVDFFQSNSSFFFDTAFQRCESQAGCSGACDVRNRSVTCQVATPTTPGVYRVSAGENTLSGQITVTPGGGTRCSL